jgi:hypothetical protein
MTGVMYRPGARAPRTGAYTVTHRTHRLSHIVLMDEGEEFPTCRRCYDDVRFELYMRIQRISADRDFAEPAEDIFGSRTTNDGAKRGAKDGSKRKVLPFKHPNVG